MQPLYHLQNHRRIKGFSLIELMVSLTIGLVIAVAAISAYLGAAGASKMSNAQSRMNEDAQAALNVLAQQIRMAGTNPVQANRADAFQHNPVFDPTYVGGSVTSYGTTSFSASSGGAAYNLSAFSIRGCDGSFSSITSTSNLDSLSNCGTSTLPDSIAVSYEGDKYNTMPSGASAGDCLGQSVPSITATFTSGTSTTATYYVVDNRFYVANSSDGIPNLYCKGNGGSVQPLVENVEDMQFLYGTVSSAATSNTATVAGYLTAEDVITNAPTADAPGYSKAWGKVLTVRICVVVRSESPVVSNAASAKYYNCANPAVLTTAPDLRLRRAYSTTVVLRNRRL